MTNLIIFYWIISGLALFLTLGEINASYLVLSLMFGGVCLPAILIARIIK